MGKLKGVAELQILNKVLQDKNWNIVEKFGLSDMYFTTPIYDENEKPTGYKTKDIYEFIKRHKDTNEGKIPDKATVLSQFPEFTFVDVNENDEYLVKTLKDDYREELFTNAQMRANDIQIKQGAKAAWDYMNQFKNIFEDIPLGKIGVDLVHEGATERLDRYEHVNDDGHKAFITSGLKELDEVMGGGFNRSEEHVIIQGRTGQSKTFLLMKFLFEAWLTGENVAIFEPEMSRIGIGYRFDSLAAKFSNFGLLKGAPQDKNYRKHIEELIASHKNKFIFICPEDFQNLCTVSKLKAFCRANNIGMLGVDGLEVPALVDERSNRYTESWNQLTNIADDLLKLSVALQIPVITTAQAGKIDKNTELDTNTIAGAYGISRKCTLMITMKKDGRNVKLKIVKGRNMDDGQELNYRVNLDRGEWMHDSAADVSSQDLGIATNALPGETSSDHSTGSFRKQNTEIDTEMGL